MWTRCLNTDLRHLNPVSLEKLFSKRGTLAYHTSSFPAGGRHINIPRQQRTKRNLWFRITDERPFSTCTATLVRGYCDPRSRSSGITLGFQEIGVLFAEFMFYACLVCVVGYYKSSIPIHPSDGSLRIHCALLLNWWFLYWLVILFRFLEYLKLFYYNYTQKVWIARSFHSL